MFFCFDNHVSKHGRLGRLCAMRTGANGMINIHNSTLSVFLINSYSQLWKKKQKHVSEYFSSWNINWQSPRNGDYDHHKGLKMVYLKPFFLNAHAVLGTQKALTTWLILIWTNEEEGKFKPEYAVIATRVKLQYTI